MMDDHGQSDGPVVPTKSPNNSGGPGAEETEGSGLAKGNSPQEAAQVGLIQNHQVSRHSRQD
jgi:hypothetical protein